MIKLKIFFIVTIFIKLNLFCMDLETPEKILLLPYNKFDQTENSGWRTIKNKLEAAKLIIQYLTYNTNLVDKDRTRLYYHAGLLFAFKGCSIKAKYCLEKAEQIILCESKFDVEEKILNEREEFLLLIKSRLAFVLQRGLDLSVCWEISLKRYPSVAPIIQEMLKNIYKNDMTILEI